MKVASIREFSLTSPITGQRSEELYSIIALSHWRHDVVSPDCTLSRQNEQRLQPDNASWYHDPCSDSIMKLTLFTALQISHRRHCESCRIPQQVSHCWVSIQVGFNICSYTAWYGYCDNSSWTVFSKVFPSLFHQTRSNVERSRGESVRGVVPRRSEESCFSVASSPAGRLLLRWEWHHG